MIHHFYKSTNLKTFITLLTEGLNGSNDFTRERIWINKIKINVKKSEKILKKIQKKSRENFGATLVFVGRDNGSTEVFRILLNKFLLTEGENLNRGWFVPRNYALMPLTIWLLIDMKINTINYTGNDGFYRRDTDRKEVKRNVIPWFASENA